MEYLRNKNKWNVDTSDKKTIDSSQIKIFKAINWQSLPAFWLKCENNTGKIAQIVYTM